MRDARAIKKKAKLVRPSTTSVYVYVYVCVCVCGEEVAEAEHMKMRKRWSVVVSSATSVPSTQPR